MRSPFPVAVTGGVAEGKSTVVAMAQAAGFTTASADRIVSDFWMDLNFREAVSDLLDLAALATREVVREVLHRDPGKRRLLNALVHPLVVDRLTDERAQVVEVPLLFESCLHMAFSRVWVVTCGPEEQRRRLMERPGGPDRWLALQLPTRAKIPFADRVIRTNVSLERVQAQVETALAVRSQPSEN